jgi:2-polyprenyl-3-methyl-5-hydroxy-6-metoxy-1,4-benzoquinol methylase
MKDYNNPKSSYIRKFIKINFLSKPLLATKSSKEKVLDLGCGWGFYFQINPMACGIDADQDCINYLKNQKFNVIQADITKSLPIKNNYYNWVICHDVLEHFDLSESEKILENIYNALNINGKLLILSPNKKGYDSGVKRGVGHKHFITLSEILKISNGKFNLKKHYFYPLPKMISEFFTHNKEIIILEKI